MIRTTAIALALAITLAVAGCGNGDAGGGYGSRDSSTTTAATNGKPAKSESAGAAASVGVATVPGAGKVLTDSQGFTLYLFEKDEGGKSACYGACAEVWPPLTTDGSAKATGGTKASMLGTVKRNDGTTQVTYAGWPLYTYQADTEPGDAKGNDVDSFGAEWYALQPKGEKAG